MRTPRLSIALVLLLVSTSLTPPAAIAQPGTCIPNPDAGCQLEFAQPTLAAITDPSDAHRWRLTLNAPAAFGVAITGLPARYRLEVYPPGAERESDRLEKTTSQDGDFLVVVAAAPGTYNIFVDSPFGETSEAPYTIVAARMIEVGEVAGGVIASPPGFNSWFVYVPPEQPVAITLSNLVVDYDLYLYRPDGAVQAVADKPGAEEDVIVLNGVEPGPYLLIVSTVGPPSTTPYRLAVTGGALGGPPPEPVAANPPAATGPLTEAEIAARVGPAVVQVETPFGLGSGVKVAAGILTNDHVVGGADRVEVVRRDGRRARATAVRCDPVLDLALLVVDLEIPAVDIGSARALRQGDPLLVLGYPRPDVLSGGSSLTRGLVSAIRTDERGSVFVQTDAAVNPGNSGGALVDNRGNLVGLPTFSIRGTQGLNFGVAAESIQTFLSGPAKPCSNGAAPETVLLSDAFSDPVAGVMPVSSGSSRFNSRYVEGEYQIQLVDATYTGLPTAMVPGSYTDASIVVDVRVVGTIPGRVVSIGCRDPDGSGGYALLVEPGNTRSILARYDSSSTGAGLLQAMTSWRGSPSIRTGNQINRLELSCVGNVITASINGTQVGMVRDTTFAAGQMWLAALATSGTVEARFDNLVVTRR